jgi:hypothetical protein
MQYGVLYPLQTFTRTRDLDFSNIPVFTEAESLMTLKALNDFASRLTNVVQQADSHARMMLHLAAVFACNFTNHMYVTAEQLLKQSNIPFEVLMPLIRKQRTKLLQYPRLRHRQDRQCVKAGKSWTFILKCWRTISRWLKCMKF